MKYCIVGIGNHARTKIYPSLIKNKNNIIFTVTRRKKNQIKNIKNFYSIKSAYRYLGNKTIYIISTPPSKHIYYLENLIKKNVEYIYCEKPLLTRSVDYKKIITLINENQKLIEIYPYKNTIMFNKFKDYYFQNQSSITKIKLKFTIPNLPNETFRDNKGIQNSLLYDMGCYPLDLLITLGIVKDIEKIKNLKYQCLKKNYILNFNYLNIKIFINVGLSKNYSNYIKLTNINKTKITFNKFFFARNTKKNITYYKKNNSIKKIFTFIDNDTFSKYFNNIMHISYKNIQLSLKKSYLNLKILELINK